MKSLWRRIGKKSLRLSRRSGSTENGCSSASAQLQLVNDSPTVESEVKVSTEDGCSASAQLQVVNDSPTVESEVKVSTENGCSASAQLQVVNDSPTVESEVKGTLVEDPIERIPEEDEKEAPASLTRTMDPVLKQVTSSFDKVIHEEEEELDGDVEEEEQVKQEGQEPISLAPATSEENLDDEGTASYCYGSQFAFHAGLYGYPVAVVRRRLAAVPVIKGFTMTDVDFPLYFSSYDIPVVSASRHASFTRRDRLVRLHNRYTSMPAMRTERPIVRATTLAATGGSSAIKMAPLSKDEVNAERP